MKRPELPNLERAVARVTTRSALNPILWLSGIVSPICFILAATTGPDLAPWFLGIGTTPVAVSLIAYIYFMLREPDRLQSEDYNLERQRIEHLGDGDTGEKGPLLALKADPVNRPDKSNHRQDEGLQ